VKGMPRRRQKPRAAQPSGPSVTIWMASGANSCSMWLSREDGNSDSLISG